MRTYRSGYLALVVVLIFCAVPFGSAVGFGDPPGNRELIFHPGMQEHIPFYVINGNFLSVSAWVNPPGNPATAGTPQDDNLAPHVSIEDSAPLTGPRPVALVVDYPAYLKPGIYTITVTASDHPEGAQSATVSAVASVQMRFTVRVLSAEKLIDPEGLVVDAVAEGLPTNATIRYVSRTTQVIDGVVATVQVLKDGQSVVSAHSAPASLASAEHKVVVISMPIEQLKGGEYEVNSTIAYDGKVIEGGMAKLKIGTLHVGVPEYTPTLMYNETNRFLFNISNEWNQELKSVYARVLINGDEKQTASQDIAPFGKTAYELYFARDELLLPGSTTANVTITFKDYDPGSMTYYDKQETIPLTLEVLSPPIAEQPALTTQELIIIGLGVALLVLIALVLVLLLRRKKPVVVQSAPVTTPPLVPPQVKP